jgi:hypothetical protein
MSSLNAGERGNHQQLHSILATFLIFHGKPWQLICSNGMEASISWLLVVFLKFREIAQLKLEISEETIHHLNNIFACHVIPVTVVSDNGP